MNFSLSRRAPLHETHYCANLTLSNKSHTAFPNHDFIFFFVLPNFYQEHPVPKKQLQLVGVTAMFLASKYEEMYPPEISDFAYVTDRAYTTAQIRDMEMTILRVLKFRLGRPLPLQFLRRASKIYEVCSRTRIPLKMVSLAAFIQSATYPHISAFQVTAEQHTLAKYLLELTMVDYEMVHFPPSMVASAALALTLKILDAGEWVSLTWLLVLSYN